MTHANDAILEARIERALRVSKNAEEEALICAIAYSQNPCQGTLTDVGYAVDDALRANSRLRDLMR